ncbi:HEPN domain-containing protein [Candidatus Nanohalobium constans]|uniref:HEPN domain-containing protein n=1 Tax=Candidatus Nanohalobium constans TaxID=2565781 RepID=A0A5Q0UEP5_9ARCH|nr:HEPN domain-containing protein [Candidatus Nanohalobium constans]QGA80053.1 hypothetical protein LC1Nh_0145 [Candidatus Nanohalobium constans]
MKEFEKFIEEGKVRETKPNPSQARSLIQKAEKRLRYVKGRNITEENADLILEDSYEAVREALDAFLVLDGYKPHSHEASIIYGFENLEIPYGTTNKLNKFRKLRNDSKYRGEDIKRKEAEKILKIAKELIPLLKEKFNGRENQQ